MAIDDFDNFKEVKDFKPTEISSEVITTVRSLDEREELEPFIRAILADMGETPHGPSEMADILTHKVTVKGRRGIAAFILKGKSFSTVRPKDVSHQIYRLQKIDGLEFAILGAPGTILDPAKEEFCSTCQQIGSHYAIFDAVDFARLFVAHGFLCPRDGNRISRGRCKCGYSPRKRILNLLQKESLKNLAKAHALGQQAGLVILPPGTGKTRIAAEDAKAANAARVLYVAHTHEILDVAESEFESKFGSENVLRLASRSSISRLGRVNITTIQLVTRNLDKFRTGQFDYVVIDEFHHAAAASYRRLIEAIHAPFLLGLTATPFRGDRQDILELCRGIIIAEYELRSGIDFGILCPYHYFGCFDDVDYSQLEHKGASYTIRDLERTLLIPRRDQAIVRKWRELAEGKATLAFCCSIKHAHRMAANFKAAGISAAVYVSDTKKEERKRIIDDFKAGEISILCVVDVMNEGADLPFVECLLFLRPTESKRIFFQQLGRGIRRFVGKSHCVIIDFIGNFKNAYRIVEYQGLLPFSNENVGDSGGCRRAKDILNLPFGCEVHFDDRVIDLFVQQTLNPKYATRQNIGRILIYQYERLGRQLGRFPTKKDVDRNLLLGSNIYALLFGSWKIFEKMMTPMVSPAPKV